MKMFVTFGQAHIHHTNGRTFDKDTVAVVYGKDEKQCNEIAFEVFKGKFYQHVPEAYWYHNHMMQFFPKGYVPLNPPMAPLLQDARVVSAYKAKRAGSDYVSLVVVANTGEHIPFMVDGPYCPSLHYDKQLAPGLLTLSEYDIPPEDQRTPIELPGAPT